jgi:hypothetical protein
MAGWRHLRSRGQLAIWTLNTTATLNVGCGEKYLAKQHHRFWTGKFHMKLSVSGLFGQAIKAATVSAALMLSMSASHAQSGPFVGFDGSWSGSGTVSLSDGTTEHIRCKADYKVTGSGLNLKQNLHCASDSYKFDLSSDVTSQGDRISGNWSEASRNVFGNL